LRTTERAISASDRPGPAATGDLSRNHREAAIRATFKFVLAVGRGDHLVHLAVVLLDLRALAQGRCGAP
jgi:hypothetical protein